MIPQGSTAGRRRTPPGHRWAVVFARVCESVCVCVRARARVCVCV